MSAACRLLFIRHAETDMAGTFCGHADPAVNARGLQQISLLLGAIRDERIDAVYTSDLRRARDTAEALGGELGLVPIHEPGLREIDFGGWEGLTWSQVEQQDSRYAQQWIENYPHLPAPGGEDFAAFTTRVLTTVERLFTLPSHRSIAVVTHAGVMRVVLTTLKQISEEEAWTITKPYCSFFDYTRLHAGAVRP